MIRNVERRPARVRWAFRSLVFLLLAFGSLRAIAVPISFHDRGPCSDLVDGVCVPNRKNFGYYMPRWRPWPGDVPPAVPSEPAPSAVPPEILPSDVPRPEDEELLDPASPRAPSPSSSEEGDEADAAPEPPLESDDTAPAIPPGLGDEGDMQLPDEPMPEIPIPQTNTLRPAASPVANHRQPAASQSARAASPPSVASSLVWKQVASPSLSSDRTDTGSLAAKPKRLGNVARSGNPLRRAAPPRPTTSGTVRRATYHAPIEEPTPQRVRANPLRSP